NLQKHCNKSLSRLRISHQLFEAPVHGRFHDKIFVSGSLSSLILCLSFSFVVSHNSIVVPQNKVPVSCTKTANYNSSLINISFTVCQKKRRAFFLCVSGYFVIVVLTTIKKEKERILPQHVL